MQVLITNSAGDVILEVILTVQRLVCKLGAEQDTLAWDLILDVTAALLSHVQVTCTVSCSTVTAN